MYTSGIYDTLMEAGIDVDLAIGVSAGCANLSAYLSAQQGRNFRITKIYGPRKEYGSMENFLKRGSFLDLDYIFGTIPNSDGLDPFDYPAFQKNPAEFIVVATYVQTGQPVYFSKEDMAQDDYDAMKASCAIPVVCRPYPVKGKLLILAPEDTCGVDTLTRDTEKLTALYQKGREAGGKAADVIRLWREEAAVK